MINERHHTAGNLCLICAGSEPNRGEYHQTCSESFFKNPEPPVMPYALKDLDDLASRIISSSTTITGVQKKLSLALHTEGQHHRLTFIGLWGNYILKSPVEAYPCLPENEYLTMRLADIAGIQTVPHALIRLKSGELAYLTRRIDRTQGGKLPMEDMAQLTERMTEEKYRGSVEQVGKIVLKHCRNRLFDALRLYELVLFSFITGNGDMHLKNYSLITQPEGIFLSPAYDLLNTRLVISEDEDRDESALSINGKRRKITLDDFHKFADHLELTRKQTDNVLKRILKNRIMMEECIRESFLPQVLRHNYHEIVETRLDRLVVGTSK